MTGSPDQAFAQKSFVSRDGTTIGYRQLGAGPGLILLHGGLESSQSFSQLGSLLADRFTVFIPDRRGRGRSGPFRPDHSMATEVGDLRELLELTGARDVFALSAGALVALHTALRLGTISRLALYEPPLEFGTVRPRYWAPGYERALQRGRLATALVAALKGTGDRGELMTTLPGFILVPLFGLVLRLRPDMSIDGGPPLAELVPTVHYDLELVAETAGSLERFRDLATKILLLGGTRSKTYLAAALDGLGAVLPNAERVTLDGAGHIAADNQGDPPRVAAELRRFFA